MSLRLQLLQVARLSPRLLGDSTDLVRSFLQRQLTPEGGGCDRAGRPDLYYTLFVLAGLQALEVVPPLDRVEAYARSFGDGHQLDFVHVSALARCWSVIGRQRMPAGLDDALLARIEDFRKPDGGYEGDRNAAHGSAYGAFVALGAYEDLGRTPPRILKLIQALKRLESADGAWSNLAGAKIGALNATAGAVILIRHLGFPVNADVGRWLLAQAHPQGGFIAVPGAPLPDLLSTATALHALAALDIRLPAAVHEKCMDFLDSLWTAEGGFHGHWADEYVDAEYTYYGLLALGHLSL
ncbi:prenyltransferase/squalene oxidase repeat-containing protein [Horticoccus sp. 23ND18S-11]|uniref:prenyltransferase/squalene oxidase repeat-containing protein n=1 Tax=Horticoccus sp. 23ND18S-11 TaxID=3391832 RepID=UPI0039C92B22